MSFCALVLLCGVGRDVVMSVFGAHVVRADTCVMPQAQRAAGKVSPAPAVPRLRVSVSAPNLQQPRIAVEGSMKECALLL